MNKPLVLVYTDHPMCSIDCADAACDVLNNSGQYHVRMIGPDSYPFVEFTQENISISDCLIFPGGLGDADQFDNDLFRHKQMIQNYVNQGGKYLGICQGSYFTSKHYFDLLTGMKAVQHIKTKKASTRRTGPSIVPLNWNDHGSVPVYFHDGAAFVPTEKEIPRDCEVLATYANGDPAAIIQRCEQGMVGAIGPHPEAQKWWFYSQSSVRDGWKTAVQHDLLLEFVDILIHDL